MPSKRDQAVELQTGNKPEMSVIWLHGLGADGHDFERLVPELRLPFSARFIFPHAPRRRITINNGTTMRAWFDVLSFDRNGAEDAQAIGESATAIQTMIDAELTRGFTAQQIVLAGFSQGGAIALHTGLRTATQIGGILALSTFLPLSKTLKTEHNKRQQLPISMMHGNYDPVIKVAFAQRSYKEITKNGFSVDWRTYPMAHELCAPQIKDIREWFCKLGAVKT